ncbi:MAG: hypothetical protein LBU32_03260 [Clostridiales bacterium]|jgi:heme/copper-type cytochrome/quinol oxidase subunit 2|nr:hypothetical protein [Clostridiales bacterium]
MDNYGEPDSSSKSVMSVGQWLITLLVSFVPCVGIIVYIVWAFDDKNLTRRNFIRANFTIGAVISVLTFFLLILIFALGLLSFNTLTDVATN